MRKMGAKVFLRVLCNQMQWCSTEVIASQWGPRCKFFFAVTYSICNPKKRLSLCHSCFPKCKMVAAICMSVSAVTSTKRLVRMNHFLSFRQYSSCILRVTFQEWEYQVAEAETAKVDRATTRMCKVSIFYWLKRSR